MVIYNVDSIIICTNMEAKKLNLHIARELSINDEIIEKIKEGFSKNSPNIYEKAKELIQFYPKNEDGKNIVKDFIDCYKKLSKIEFNEEEIETKHIDLWKRTIEILLIKTLEIINNDKSITKTSERTETAKNKKLRIGIRINLIISILIILILLSLQMINLMILLTVR